MSDEVPRWKGYDYRSVCICIFSFCVHSRIFFKEPRHFFFDPWSINLFIFLFYNTKQKNNQMILFWKIYEIVLFALVLRQTEGICFVLIVVQPQAQCSNFWHNILTSVELQFGFDSGESAAQYRRTKWWTRVSCGPHQVSFWWSRCSQWK